MARVKIILPETYCFKTEIQVRVTDINYGGHLGNDSLLGILHQARILYLGSLGYSELNLEASSLIMADVAIEYKGEAFLGDLLTIEIATTEFTKYGFDLVYRVINQQEKPIAYAKTGMLCFDYSTRKLMTLPEKARINLENISTKI